MGGHAPQYRDERYALLDAIGVALAVWDALPSAGSLRVVERTFDAYDDFCNIKAR